MRAVVALGGNALVPDGGTPTAEEQSRAMQATAAAVADAIDAGHDIVLTHGNGPQVGERMLQQAASADTVDMPLDVLVAETQGQIGALLQRALDNAMDDATATTIVTQVLVDPDDPGFDDPTKPVGPWYTADEAEQKAFETRDVGEGERSHRRVVPSPEPVHIVEQDSIAAAVDRGEVVVCCGGGGVPVVADDGLQGVEAVIDKDRASAVLADGLDADVLAILTDVPYAYRGYGTPDEEAIEEISVAELQALLEDGAFGAGSMRPKVEACIDFIHTDGDRAVITTPGRLAEGLAGEAGTQVTP